MGAIHQALLSVGGAAAPPPDDPSTIASIWEWWEPSRGGFADNDAITTLAGEVAPGSGHDFTQSTVGLKPTYKASILNGLGIARFDGTDDSLQNVNPSALTAAHLWMVIKVATETAATGMWQFGTSGSTDHFAFTDNNIYDGACSTTRKTVGNPTPALVAWHVVEVVSISGEWTWRLNGATTGAGEFFTTATNTVGISTNCKLGTWGTLERACDIAGVYLFSAKLTTDRATMVTYLNDRFALSIS